VKQDDESLYGGPLDMPGKPLQSPSDNNSHTGFSAKKLLFGLLGLALVSGLVFGGWKLYGHKKPNQSVQQQTQPSASSQTSSPQGDVPASSEMKTFKTDHPRVSFSYPATWTIAEKDYGVRLESPEFKYKTTDQTQVNGYFRIYIRQGARTADSKYIGRGVALQPSEKLAYAEPAPGQRGETNLTQFGLDTPDHFAYFLIAGNYSLKKGDTLGPGYGKEPETYIVTGGYSAKELTDDLATNKIPLDYFQTTNAYKQALEILKTLKLL